jgi:hypothetical protein
MRGLPFLIFSFLIAVLLFVLKPTENLKNLSSLDQLLSDTDDNKVTPNAPLPESATDNESDSQR